MKFEFIDAQKAHFPIDFMCQQLSVSRSGYYAWKERPESERHKADQVLAQEVVAVHQQSRGRYGSPRVHAELRARGRRVSRKRVARLMGQQGLAARKKRRFVQTTDSRHAQPVAPNLLERDFSPGQPNRTWATDITYVWTRQGWLYLAVIMDLFSRRIVGWAMSEHIDRHLVLNALDMALKGRQPAQGLLHHSDRGSQYGQRGLPAGAGRSRDSMQHVAQGQLLGQRRGRELLQQLEAGARPRSRLCHARAGAHGALRVHRGLLQPSAAALIAGLRQSSRF
jgi:putative transposase